MLEIIFKKLLYKKGSHPTNLTRPPLLYSHQSIPFKYFASLLNLCSVAAQSRYLIPLQHGTFSIQTLVKK